MKRCCFLRLTAGKLVGNRAGSPDVCQDCSHSEPKLSTGYMPQGRHSTQELQHRLSHFICTTANMLLGWGGERWEAKAPGIWIQQGCAAGKSPGQDLLQNQHSPSPSQVPVSPQICISFGSEFVMCQPDGCQGDMICSVTSSHVRMSSSEPDTPVHLIKPTVVSGVVGTSDDDSDAASDDARVIVAAAAYTCTELTVLLIVQFSSVAQSYLTLCNPMNRSTPGLPVHHQLPESTQTHVQVRINENSFLSSA